MTDQFIRLSRNPDVPQPKRVERTLKLPGHVEILSEHEMRRRAGK